MEKYGEIAFNSLTPTRPRFTVELIGQNPLASGSKSDVYEHPFYPDILVKVVRDEQHEQGLLKRIGRRRRYGYLLDYLRCLEQQAAVLAFDDEQPRCLEKAYGFITTDRGTGLLVKAELLDGKLAPTLGSIVRNRCMSLQLLAKLDFFLARLIDSPIVVNDLAFENVVLSDQDGDGPSFILIDGYGDTAGIPIKSWMKWMNRRSKIKACKLLRSRLIGKLKHDSPLLN